MTDKPKHSQQSNDTTLLEWDDSQAQALSLPSIDGDARAHCETVKRHVLDKIYASSNQQINFEDFMATSLYAPGLGYYAAGLDIFNQTGDFITAPTMGELFAIGLSNALAPLITDFNNTLVEFGAGNGDLAIKLLKSLKAADSLPEQYHIIELSPSLAAQQQQRISEALESNKINTSVKWHHSLETVPDVGIVVANEVLDAMPHARFEMLDGKPQAVVVTANENQLDYRLIEKRQGVAATLFQPWVAYWAEDNHQFAEGLQSEYSPYLPGWLEALKQHFKRSLIYLIDYGEVASQFYLSARENGTMICHYRHRAHDEMRLYPGLQDISASVEFSAVAHFGFAAELELVGFTTQAAFLLDNGLLDTIEQRQDSLINQASPTSIKPQEFQLLQEAKRLLMPGEMGERFKVMCFAISADDVLDKCKGFDQLELSEQL